MRHCLVRPIHLALDLVTSPLRPWPRLRAVVLLRVPTLELERELRDVEDEVSEIVVSVER